MRRFAVAFANLIDNDLHIEIVEAGSAISAIKLHSRIATLDYDALEADLEQIKSDFFDFDCLVDVAEVP